MPTKPYPQDVDEGVADFVLRQLGDFTYHSDFCQDIDILLNATSLVTKPLAIDKVHKVMVNFKYNLGFKVDRFELAKAISGVNGFYAQYDNSVEYNVTITLPYKLPEEQKTLRKKDKIPCHTFIVYMSGIVTQSGPGEELMRGAYYKFMNTVYSLPDTIRINARPRTRLRIIET
jgi:hypothetical protein